MTFKYEQDTFIVYPEQFKRTETRHGVRTVCNIYRNGKVVAVLDDLPERIVAPVSLAAAGTPDAKRLLQEAQFGQGDSIDERLSSYLRDMTLRADEAWSKSLASPPPETDGWFLGALAYMLSLDEAGFAATRCLRDEALQAECLNSYDEGYEAMAAHNGHVNRTFRTSQEVIAYLCAADPSVPIEMVVQAFRAAGEPTGTGQWELTVDHYKTYGEVFSTLHAGRNVVAYDDAGDDPAVQVFGLGGRITVSWSQGK